MLEANCESFTEGDELIKVIHYRRSFYMKRRMFWTLPAGMLTIRMRRLKESRSLVPRLLPRLAVAYEPWGEKYRRDVPSYQTPLKTFHTAEVKKDRLGVETPTTDGEARCGAMRGQG